MMAILRRAMPARRPIVSSGNRPGPGTQAVPSRNHDAGFFRLRGISRGATAYRGAEDFQKAAQPPCRQRAGYPPDLPAGNAAQLGPTSRACLSSPAPASCAPAPPPRSSSAAVKWYWLRPSSLERYSARAGLPTSWFPSPGMAYRCMGKIRYWPDTVTSCRRRNKGLASRRPQLFPPAVRRLGRVGSCRTASSANPHRPPGAATTSVFREPGRQSAGAPRTAQIAGGMGRSLVG